MERIKREGHYKVMHIALSLGGGVEVYTRMLIEYTYRCFDTVLVCVPGWKKELLPENSCTVYEVDVPRNVSPLSDIRAVLYVRSIIKKEKPDIVYCHSSKAGAVGRMAVLGLGCTTVYNPHGWSFDMDVSKGNKLFYCLLEYLLSKVTDRIVTISEYEKRIAIENKICSENKLQVILNGINPEKSRAQKGDRKEWGYSERDFIIGCSARLSEQKDPLLFADVAGCIAKKEPNARFIWIGDGNMREAFEKALIKNNVRDKTMITGWVDDPCRYISLLDVAVLFSKWEGFGLCLAEYITLGKPVVATDVGAVSEIIKDGVCGRLTTDRDPEGLAEIILSYRFAENREEIKKRCIKEAAAFDFKITAEKTIRLLNTMAERR